MLTKKLTSLQHPLIKHWTSLRKNKEYREEKQALLIAGKKIIGEYPHRIKTSIGLAPPDFPAEEAYLVTEEMLKKITGLEQPDGWAAEIPLPSQKVDLDAKKAILVLDQIQDPGNLGTLLRTSLAFGWDAVVATPGTVDFFNDKAIRAAKGATFRLPLCRRSAEELALWLQERPRNAYVADARGKPFSSLTPSSPLLLILGSEGSGASAAMRKLAHPISIPMQNQVDSLNVAIAGAILLYHLRGEG